ncbi:glycosyltransferase family 2 protein [Devosia sp. 919]|uniref:glycosyltransferase n=1 Tax=Devosia sp. 919 TaxID=2726065 RepID=UPI0015578108
MTGHLVQLGCEPLVSVVMANHCGAPFLATAIQSVLGQSHAKLELIVVDDASCDNSVEIIRSLAASDARLRLLALPQNCGPAAARNAGLDAAQGEWVAVVDADDLIEPDRLAQLLHLARAFQADIVADDLAFFMEGAAPHHRLLGGLELSEPTTITPEMLITERAAARGASVQFGYLKPMIRRQFAKTARYNEQLRIGEDYELLLRLVLEGARLCVTPQSFYHYRRHSASLSHRLSTDTARAMLQSHDDLARVYAARSPGIRAAFERRRQILSEQLAYEHLVEALKQRRFVPAANAVLRQPALLRHLAVSVRERLARRGHRSSYSVELSP